MIIAGPLGEMSLGLSNNIQVKILGEELRVERMADDKKTKAAQGTMVRLITNAIQGVTQGFEKILEIVGTGFKAQLEGKDLVLSLGFSHPVRFTPSADIKLEVLPGNQIRVFGVDKEKVGTMADKIKKIKKPDAYKGKGIRYLGEKLKLKPGKAAAKAAVPGAK